MDFDKLVADIERKAAENITTDTDDYIEDGLLHCGKCRTPKQVRVILFDKERTPMCLCKCAVEQKEREEEAARRAEFEKKVEKLRRVGFPDEELKGATFDADDGNNEKISLAARNYVKNFATMRENGKGLLLYGGVGRGKTFIAACIANELINKGYPCLVTNFSRIINTIQGMFEGRQQYIDSLNRFDLLVIDDLAAERNTEYVGEIVQTIIDGRYRAGLPVIITTNLTGEELKNPSDIQRQRTYSRLLEMCIPIEVTGRDRRKEKLKAEFKNYADLLGV